MLIQQNNRHVYCTALVCDMFEADSAKLFRHITEHNTKLSIMGYTSFWYIVILTDIKRCH